MKIHIGCSMSHSTPEFLKSVNQLKVAIVSNGFTLVEGPSWERECDLYVAIVDYPSTVMGMEIIWMSIGGTTVLAVAHVDSKVSPDLERRSSIHRFRRYRNLVEDVLAEIITLQM